MNLALFLCGTLFLMFSTLVRATPDWTMTLLYSPLPRGEICWRWAEMPPADSPKRVTRSGSPPKAAMFS